MANILEEKMIVLGIHLKVYANFTSCLSKPVWLLVTDSLKVCVPLGGSIWISIFLSSKSTFTIGHVLNSPWTRIHRTDMRDLKMDYWTMIRRVPDKSDTDQCVLRFLLRMMHSRAGLVST